MLNESSSALQAGSFVPIQSNSNPGVTAANTTNEGKTLLNAVINTAVGLGGGTVLFNTNPLNATMGSSAGMGNTSASPFLPTVPTTLGPATSAYSAVRPASEFYTAFMRNTLKETGRVIVGGGNTNDATAHNTEEASIQSLFNSVNSTSRFRAAVARYRTTNRHQFEPIACNTSANPVGSEPSPSLDAAGYPLAATDAAASVEEEEMLLDTTSTSDGKQHLRHNGALPKGNSRVSENARIIGELIAPAPQFTTPQPVPETHAQFYLHKVASVEDEDNGVVVYPNVPFGSNVFINSEYDAVCQAVAAHNERDIIAQRDQLFGADTEQTSNSSNPNSTNTNNALLNFNHQLADPLYVAEVTRRFITETAIRDIKRQSDFVDDDQKRRADSQFHMGFLSPAVGGPSLTIAHAGGPIQFYGGPDGKHSSGGSNKSKDKGALSGDGAIAAEGVAGGGKSGVGGGGGVGGLLGLGGSRSIVPGTPAGGGLYYSTHPFASTGGTHANPKHTFYGISDKRLLHSVSDVLDSGRFLASLNRLGSCNTATINAYAPLNPPPPPIAINATQHGNSVDNMGVHTSNMSNDDVTAGGGVVVPGAPFRVYTACVIEKLNTAERSDTNSTAAAPSSLSNKGGVYTNNNTFTSMNGPSVVDGGSFNRPPSTNTQDSSSLPPFSNQPNRRPTSPLAAGGSNAAGSASVDDFTGFALLHSRSMPPRFISDHGLGSSADPMSNSASDSDMFGTSATDQASQHDVYCTIVLYRPKRKQHQVQDDNRFDTNDLNSTVNGAGVMSSSNIHEDGSIGTDYPYQRNMNDGSYAANNNNTNNERNRASSFMSGGAASSTHRSNASPPLGSTPRPNNHASNQVNNNILLCAAHRHHDSFAKRYRECCELDYECFVQETVVVPWATRNSTLEYTNVIAQSSWDAKGQPFVSIGGGLLFIKTRQNTNTVDLHEKRLAVVSRVGFLDVYKYVREVGSTERRVAEATAVAERAKAQREILLADHYQQNEYGELMLAPHVTAEMSAASRFYLSTTQANTSSGSSSFVAAMGAGAEVSGEALSMFPLANEVLALEKRAASLFATIAIPRMFPQEVVFWRSPDEASDGSSVSNTGTAASGPSGGGNGNTNSNNTFINVAIDYRDADLNSVSSSSSALGKLGSHSATNSVHNGLMSGDRYETMSSGGASSSSGAMLGGYANAGFAVNNGGGAGGAATSSSYGHTNATLLGAAASFQYVAVPTNALFHYASICIATCYSHYTEEQLLAEGYAMGGRSTAHQEGGASDATAVDNGGDGTALDEPTFDISYRCAGVMISVSSNNQVAVAKLTRKQLSAVPSFFGDAFASTTVDIGANGATALDGNGFDFTQSISGVGVEGGGSPTSPLMPSTPHGHLAPKPSSNQQPHLGKKGTQHHPLHHGAAPSRGRHHWDEAALASTYPQQEVSMRISIPTTLPWNQNRIVQELIDFRIPTTDAVATSTINGEGAEGFVSNSNTTGGVGKEDAAADEVAAGLAAGGEACKASAASNDGSEAIACRIANSAGQQYIICFAQDLVESQWMGTLLHVQYAPFFLRHQHHTYLSYFAQRAHSQQPWRDDFRYALRHLPIRFFEGPNAQSTFNLDPRAQQQVQLQPIVQCVATFSIPKQVTKAYYCSRDRILFLGANDGSAAVVGEGSSTWQTLFAPTRRRTAAMTEAEAASALSINTVASVRIPSASLKKRARFGAKACSGAGNSSKSHTDPHSMRGGNSSKSKLGASSRHQTHHDDDGCADGGAVGGGARANNEDIAAVCPTSAMNNNSASPATDEETLQAFHRMLRTTYNIKGAFAEAYFEEIFSPLAMLMGGASSQLRVPQHYNLTRSEGSTKAMLATEGGGASAGASSSFNNTAANGDRKSDKKKEAENKKDAKKSDAKRSSSAIDPQSTLKGNASSQETSANASLFAATSLANLLPTSQEILSNRKDIQQMVGIVDFEPTIYHDVYMVTTPFAAALIHVAIRKTQQTISTLIIEEEEEVLSDDYDSYKPCTLDTIDGGRPLSSEGSDSRANKGVITLSHTSKSLPEVKSVSLTYVLRVLSRKVGHYTLASLGSEKSSAAHGASSGSGGLLSFFRRGKGKDSSTASYLNSNGSLTNLSELANALTCASSILASGGCSGGGAGGNSPSMPAAGSLSGAKKSSAAGGSGVAGGGGGGSSASSSMAGSSAGGALMPYASNASALDMHSAIAAVNAVKELVASGGMAAHLTQTQFNLLHVHLPTALLDATIIPPLAFLSAPIAFTRQNQNKHNGAVAGRVSSGSAVLLHTVIDPRRLDAAVNGAGILGPFYQHGGYAYGGVLSGYGGGGGGNSVYGRAAARARQILMGNGSYNAPTSLSAHASPRGPLMLTSTSNYSQQQHPSSLLMSTPDAPLAANQPMSLMALPPPSSSAAPSVLDGADSGFAPTNKPNTADHSSPRTAANRSSPSSPSSSASPKGFNAATRESVATTSSTNNNNNTSTSASKGGVASRILSKLFGSTSKKDSKGRDTAKENLSTSTSLSRQSTTASSVFGRPATTNSSTVVAGAVHRTVSGGLMIGGQASSSAGYDNASFATVPYNGSVVQHSDMTPYRQSSALVVDGNMSSTGRGGKDASISSTPGVGTASSRGGGGGKAAHLSHPTASSSCPSSTDLEIVTSIKSSHHALPQRELVEEVRSNPATVKGSRDTMDDSPMRRRGSNNSTPCSQGGNGPFGGGGGTTRRIRRIERTIHSIETPVIVSLTSPNATNPSHYPDPRTFALNMIGGGGGGGYNATASSTLKYATSLSWGVAAYDHPADLPPQGPAADGANVFVGTASRGANPSSGVTRSGYQYTFHPGGSNSAVSPQQSDTLTASQSASTTTATTSAQTAPSFRTRSIVQPDLLERFDVFKQDCSSENTVNNLCDGYSRKVSTGEEVPVTVLALDARLHGVLCILHTPGKGNDHEIYCVRDGGVHEGLGVFTENCKIKGF